MRRRSVRRGIEGRRFVFPRSRHERDAQRGLPRSCNASSCVTRADAGLGERRSPSVTALVAPLGPGHRVRSPDSTNLPGCFNEALFEERSSVWQRKHRRQKRPAAWQRLRRDERAERLPLSLHAFVYPREAPATWRLIGRQVWANSCARRHNCRSTGGQMAACPA